MKKVIQILLLVVIIVLAYLSYKSIMKPIEFGELKKAKYSLIIQQLKDIRKAQNAYKEVHGDYTGSFDTLISFIKFDSIPQIKALGSLTDEQVEAGMSEKEAVRKGIIIRDTIMISALDTIFNRTYPIDDMRFVPTTNKKDQFSIAKGIIITGSKVKVFVFEVKVSNKVIFRDLRPEYTDEANQENGDRLRLNKYPGLKIGSLTEANNGTGNWE